MSKHPLALMLLVPALLVPAGARAGVVINEVAWMGTDESASCEWVEFRNDGEAVSLAGWTFTIANGNSTPKVIALSGNVGAGEYFILARNASACLDDANGVSGYTFTSFGSGISNSASVLTLSRAEGEEDEVDASDGWSAIGGENESGAPRKTAQRAGTGWVTALPTPMQENAAGSDTATTTEPAPSDTGTSTPTVTIGGAAPSNGPLDKSPLRALLLDAGVNRIVHVGVATPFEAVAYDEDGGFQSGARIRWSFGDGRTQEGRSVEHTYRTPGTYLVSVRAREDEATVLRTLTVIAEKPALTISHAAEGIELRNESTRIADLSGWQLMAADRAFVIPEDTAILPKTSVVFVPEVTGLLLATSSALLLPDGTEAARFIAEAAAKPEPLVQPVSPVRGIQQVQKVDLPTKVPVQAHEEVIKAPAAPTSEVAAGAVLAPSKNSRPDWLLCLLGSPLACGAALIVP